MLKQLIQRLLDSRTTPAQAGHNAMPVNIAEAIDIFLAVGSEGSYTAPADGYLSAMVEPGGNMNFWGQILPISSFPIQNVQGKLFVPMAKGMEVRYFINGTVSLSKFLKTIGGGYNLFIWRALSCLRALSNYLLRNFCKANPSGSATKQCRSLTQQTKLNSHRQISTLSTLRQVMATSPCTRETTRGLNCTTETELSLVLHPAQRTVIYKWPQLRVQELTTWLATRMEALQKSLFPLLQQSERNALTGGALC